MINLGLRYLFMSCVFIALIWLSQFHTRPDQQVGSLTHGTGHGLYQAMPCHAWAGPKSQLAHGLRD